MTTPEAGSAHEPAFRLPGLGEATQLWLVRHGETEWSATGKHTGRTDVPLSGPGERQAAALRDTFADVRPVLVLSSPRSRAKQTAELAGLHVDEVTEELAEWDYGEYEGRTTPEIRREVPGWTIWTHGAPGGETADQVRARADRVLESVATSLGNGPVVLIGHGHFSRALGARWAGLPVAGGARLLLGTAATCLLGAEHGTPAVRHWNLPNPTTD